jgi:cycloeucalenol cycloisomerase
MDRMLRYGSLFYSLYFIASFPIFYQLDEDRDRNWSLQITCAAALSASMIMMFLLDFAASVFGPLT